MAIIKKSNKDGSPKKEVAKQNVVEETVAEEKTTSKKTVKAPAKKPAAKAPAKKEAKVEKKDTKETKKEKTAPKKAPAKKETAPEESYASLREKLKEEDKMVTANDKARLLSLLAKENEIEFSIAQSDKVIKLVEQMFQDVVLEDKLETNFINRKVKITDVAETVFQSKVGMPNEGKATLKEKHFKASWSALQGNVDQSTLCQQGVFDEETRVFTTDGGEEITISEDTVIRH